MGGAAGWEPATDSEVALYDALAVGDQEGYFQALGRINLLLPVSADAAAGRTPIGWGTWTANNHTHLLAFTSDESMRTCLAQHVGGARRMSLRDLAAVWPNNDWWLAVDPGLPIEGYLPAWFVAQLARGDARLPGQWSSMPRDRLERVQALERAKAAKAAALPREPIRTVATAGGLLALPPASASPRWARGASSVVDSDETTTVLPSGPAPATVNLPPAKPYVPEPYQTPPVPPPPRRRTYRSEHAGQPPRPFEVPLVPEPYEAPPVPPSAAHGRFGSPPAAPPVQPAPTRPAPGQSPPEERPVERPVVREERPVVREERPVERPVVREERPMERPLVREERPVVREERPMERPAVREEREERPVQAEERPVPRAEGPRHAEREPEFVPANAVEEQLYEAASAGNTDAFLSTLLLATVLIPKASGTTNGKWRPQPIDGEPHIVSYTSTQHLTEPLETIPIRFIKLISEWPDPNWSFAVNPGTPVGATLPGGQLLALANWAAEVGLGGEDEDVDEPSIKLNGTPVAGRVNPEVTVLQKAIAPSQVGYYLQRGYDRVTGFVHRAHEVGHLKNPSQMREALGLDWEGSPFSVEADEIYLLRWSAHRPSLYRIPYGGHSESAMRAMQGWVIERAPFRGNGFAPGESKEVIAEFKVDSARLPHGARLLRLKDGAEEMVAVFDADLQRWLRTEGGA